MIRNLEDNAYRASAQNQAWIDDAAFSGYCVLYLETDGDNTNNTIIIFQGSSQNPHRVTWDRNNAEIEVRVVGGGGNAANIAIKVGKTGDLNANGGLWAVGTYLLVAWNYEPVENRLTAWARSPDTNGRLTGTATHAGTVNGLNNSGWRAGWSGASGEAFLGNWLYVGGAGAIDGDDFDAMYAALMPNGSIPACHVAYLAGGGGADFHVGLVHPTSAGAKSGDALTLTNLAGRVSAGTSQLGTHTLSAGEGEMTLVAPDDYPPSGGWTRTKPGTAVSQALVPKALPTLKQLGEQGAVTGLKRILITGNSRSIGHNDSAGGDGAFSGGFEYQLIQNVLLAGVGVGWNSAGSPRRVFGDANGAASTGTIQSVSGGGANSQKDFSRIGSGSAQAPSFGPGSGVYMASGATYTPGAKSDEAAYGLISENEPLTLRLPYAKFPGAGTLRWRRAKGEAVNAATEYGDAAVDIDCDTATATHTYDTGTDSYNEGTKTLVLDTSGALIPVGHLVHNANRTSIAQVASCILNVDESSVTITLRHAFQTAPENGDTLHIGPYEIAAIDVDHAADAVNVWRHVHLTAVDGPVLVLPFVAFNPDADGYVVMSIGWGGHGYDDQLDQSFTGNYAQLIAALGADAVIQSYVTQDSDASHVDDFLAEIRAALGVGVEVFQFGEGCHSNSSTTLANQTDTTARNNTLGAAESEGVAAQDFIEHATLGTYLEQVVNFEREDTAHLSARGANKIAGILLDAFAELPDPPAPSGGGGVNAATKMLLELC